MGSLQLARTACASPEAKSASAPSAWLYPQALSIDAPSVAVLWQWLFARSFGQTITPLVLALTAASVWVIYTMDHLLDVHAGLAYSQRHVFVRRHRRFLWIAVVAVLLAAAPMCLELPRTILSGGLMLSVVVIFYLALVHAAPSIFQRYFPKELAIGILFGLGSTIPVWTDRSLASKSLPASLLFSALCTLNVAGVDCWEWQQHQLASRLPHTSTRWIGRRLQPTLALVAALAGAFYLVEAGSTMFAILLSSFLLSAVSKLGDAVPAEARRLLADASLLTPLIFLLK